MTGRRVFMGALLVVALGCGGGSDVTTPPAVFYGSTTAMSPDGVRLIGSGAGRSTVLVRVVLGGPTTSSDLYGFAFDLVLGDPTAAQYVPGSARFGDALETDGAQGRSVLASQVGDRVVIGISKTGGGSGNGLAGSGESIVLSLEFDVPNRGMTTLGFAGSPNNPVNPTGDPAALDSTGALVPSIRFDVEPALISR